MFLTRIGENSKIVVNGDPSQIDLPNKNMSGLNRSKQILSHLNEIGVVDFDHSDVVRHPLVSKIVKAYNNNDKVNVLSEEKSWAKKIKLKKEKFFNKICKFLPKKFIFLNKFIYLTLLLSNNSSIQKLNKKFRNKNKHTDILSFPSQMDFKKI